MRGRRRKPLKERFLRFVLKKTSGCWIWTGTKNGSGYGTIGLGGKEEGKGFAHRVAWELFHGPIPKGMLVCHKCDVKLCVNPDHLFLGTYQDNVDDMVRKGRNLRGATWYTKRMLETRPRGSKHGHAKLTERKVVQIRRLFATGHNKAALARKFGVCRAMIRFIVNRRNWTHV